VWVSELGIESWKAAVGAKGAGCVWKGRIHSVEGVAVGYGLEWVLSSMWPGRKVEPV
jgi:hypothetical protein